jgi:hypothetical protein
MKLITTAETEKNFSFADLDGSETENKLAHQIRIAYIAWQLDQPDPFIQLNDIKRTDSAYWITNYAWILQS